MKIECVTDKLEYALTRAQRVTGKNLTLPVLNYLYLEAHGRTLSIRATNLDLGIEVTIPAKVSHEGVVVVPGDVFAGFVSSLRGERSVVCEVSDGNLVVTTDGSTSTIKAHPHEDFPKIPHVEGGASLTAPAHDLTRCLKDVQYSASASTVKPELSSVFITSPDSQLVFVATDSFRLAERTSQIKNQNNFPDVLIPQKNVPEIIRILEEVDEEVTVLCDGNQVAFRFDGVYLTSRIIDGTFPDYKQIIPTEATTEVVVLKEDLEHTLKTARIFSDKLNQIVFTLDPAQKTFSVSTHNSDVGENTNTLKATLTGEPLTITFNYTYIIDCFSSLTTDSISLSLNGSDKRVVVHPVSDSSFL